MYTLVNKKEFSKEETVIFFLNRTISTKFYIYGFFEKIKEYFEKDYNVVFIGYDLEKYLSNYSNFYNFNTKTYKDLKETKMKRKHELENNAEYNNQLVIEKFNVLDGIKNVKHILIFDDIPLILPLGQFGTHEYFKRMKNEFHDYVGNDKTILKLIEDKNEEIGKNLETRLSMLAFTQFQKLIFILTYRYLYEKHKKTLDSFYGFVIDPSFYHPWFKVNNIPFKAFYFEDDSRGTRNFKKFPISHLQHLVYEKQLGGNMLFKTEKLKEYDFIFAGTILHEKGSRADMWKKFFNDLDIENSSLYIPLTKNVIINNRTVGINKRTQITKDIFPEIYSSIENHKSYKGYLLPDKVSEITSQYKYGMVLRCVSANDSLNFRPVFYLNLDVLPFFDEQYDPEYLQIPKRFQDKLVVRDHTDIERLVKYYNENDDERVELLNELKDYFQIEYFKSNWKTELDKIFKK